MTCRKRLTLSGLVIMALLAGCSGLSSRAPAEQVYLLQPMPAMAGASARAAAATGSTAVAMADVAPAGSLAVSLPVAAPGLDSTNISLVQADGRLDAYAASRWPEVLSVVLQPLMIDALRAGGRFASVQAENTPFAAEYLLQVEVRQFAAEYAAGAAPTVHIHWIATLGRRADRRILRSFEIDRRVQAADNRLGAIVAAFNAATGAALQELAVGTGSALPR